MKQFQQELTELKQRVMPMAALAESMVADASEGLAADPARIAEVRRNEPILDRYQIEFDREAIRLITIYTSVAKDLRFPDDRPDQLGARADGGSRHGQLRVRRSAGQ